MPILNACSYNNISAYGDMSRSKPVFRSHSRCKFNKDKQIICNYTKFLREDLLWKKFAALLYDKYRYADRVNVVNMACSDGSEPLSLMAVLVHCLGEAANKFFPIKASDVDERIITEAKSGFYKIDERDLYRLNMILGHYSDYFSIFNNKDINFPYKLSVLPKYSDKVIFEQMGMSDAIKYIEPKNNVILCRNALPYLKNNKEVEFIEKLSDILDETSLLVIGSYDNGHNINTLLKSCGFRLYELENVYCKY